MTLVKGKEDERQDEHTGQEKSYSTKSATATYILNISLRINIGKCPF